MSDRYSVKICTPTIVTVIVVADSFKQAQERALRREGDTQHEPEPEEAYIKAVERLED